MRNSTLSSLAAILLAALIIAATSTAYAWETNKTSSGMDIKWGNESADYLINPSSGPSGSVDAVLGGMATWSDVPSSTFSFSGTEGSTPCSGSYSGNNAICFGPISQRGVVAQNSFWYNSRTGEMIHSEIVFNTRYNWTIGGSSNSFDVQNIITHELGHTLSLMDEYSAAQSENTMYGYASYNETKKRTLEDDDIAGISYLYPNSNPPNATPPPPPPPASCSYAVSISDTTYPASGGTGSATVNTQDGCTWSASSSASWVTMSAPSGSSQPFTVEANTTSAIRMATITVAGESYIITQSATSQITIAAAPSSLSFGTVRRNRTLTKNSVITISGSAITAINFYISGTNAAEFPSTYSCPNTFSNPTTCKLYTTFRPTTAGTKSASIDVYVNNGESKLSIPLMGKGR